MDALIMQGGQLLLSLSILIVLHELGHFLPAKYFKTRVEKFYLFFDPKFSLFKKKIGETEYGIGWLPLGGYVKISGMVDESMDTEQLNQPPQDWEFRSKPAWQRLIIMAGGVTVNVILGIIIYIGVMYVWGDDRIPTAKLENGIYASDTLAINMGIENGDRIVRVDGETIDDFNKLIPHMLMTEAEQITVERNGRYMDLDVPYHFNKTMIERKMKGFVSIAFPFVIDSVFPDQNAALAGLQSGDELIALNGQEMRIFEEYKNYFESHKGDSVNLTVLRNRVTENIDVKISDKGLIGVRNNLVEYLPLEHRSYSFLESIPAGISKGYYSLWMMGMQLKLMFSPKTEGYKHAGGFIAIANVFDISWNWQVFWTMTAMLSIMLAVMNLLPIPALDGGHIMFLIYEIIVGKAVNQKVLEAAQMVGVILLLGLVVVVNGNDIYKLFQ